MPRVCLQILLLLLTIPVPGRVTAQSLPSAEKQKIEALITYVAERNDAAFVRNGKNYDAATAATFLRRKWQANEPEVKSARDFIEKIASFSETSGKRYLIRLQDGSEIESGDFLRTQLEKIESSGEAAIN